MATTTLPYNFPVKTTQKDIGLELNISFLALVQALNNVTAAGMMVMYGGTTAPSGWLLCDGTAVSRTTYADLFTAISTNFGAGDGSTTFNVPDMRQRFPIGRAASGTGSTLGGTGGNIDHNHTSAAHTHTSAAHTHTVPAHFHGMGTGADFNIVASGSHTHNTTIEASGGGPAAPLVSGVAAGNGSPVITASQTHAHVSGNFAGSVGLVTGGVDGNASMTSGSTTPADTGSTTPANTGTNNPPFVSVNYIVKT